MPESMKEIEIQAAEKLKELLGEIPPVILEDVELEAFHGDRGIDIRVRLRAFNHPHTLVCEVKANGQPRHVRSAVLQLRNYVAHVEGNATPIFVAPYLSPDSQELCREHGVGFMDLQGNAYITFEGVFIERLVGRAPPAEKRELKSLFKPKAAQVLLVMLRDPERAWRVAELAEAAEVSLGHVSNVRAALLDREWAQADSDGMFLAEPDSLLDAWQEDYEPPAGKKLRFYTPLHGSSFDEAVRRVLRVGADKAHAVLASFSAAHWLAPYARTGSNFFYADDIGLERLKEELRLSSTSKGENVVITLPKDSWLLTDTTEPAPGIFCTSPARTYLDLASAGERGREAADHLRREELKWQK
ncbi:type IV toxin-antitoxin system AbiEi family antitoxin [Sneathiella sp.]|uniref:type IV toxin-antitoxin system AbiEi family antitoxin n=1 Tax=Sneathiella sp. TaxID=1964365 RepID=UPI0025ECB66D|nr:type IV toxin-antitoxin system AbiEi family antitoxin [Sneathiella sp.]